MIEHLNSIYIKQHIEFLIKIINNSGKKDNYEKFEKYVKIKKTSCYSRCV